MTNEEIKREIDNKYKAIEEIFEYGNFVLNKKVEEIENQISKLQNECTHAYDSNGSCKYCYKKEEWDGSNII